MIKSRCNLKNIKRFKKEVSTSKCPISDSRTTVRGLTLKTLMSHICDVSPLRGSECVPSITKPTKSL